MRWIYTLFGYNFEVLDFQHYTLSYAFSAKTLEEFRYLLSLIGIQHLLFLLSFHLKFLSFLSFLFLWCVRTFVYVWSVVKHLFDKFYGASTKRCCLVCLPLHIVRILYIHLVSTLHCYRFTFILHFGESKREREKRNV